MLVQLRCGESPNIQQLANCICIWNIKMVRTDFLAMVVECLSEMVGCNARSW